MDREPDTGAVIVHVISDAWGPFVDIRATYQSLARRRPWTHVITPAQFWDRMKDPAFWDDPRCVFVLWEMLDPGPKHLRQCKVVHVYAEAMDDDLSDLLPAHHAHWLAFKERVVHYDAVLTHTPWTSDFVRKHTTVGLVFTMPVGWDAEAMGAPRWNAPKHTAISYHGSMCGRRELFVPYLATHCAGAWSDATGCFGRALLGRLDTSRLSLYVAHSPVYSFSTWRIWQMASTSAALVVEGDVDVWPLTEDAFIQLPRMSPENIKGVATELLQLSRADDARLRAAARTHEIANHFTVDRSEDDYLVPAIQRMLSP